MSTEFSSDSDRPIHHPPEDQRPWHWPYSLSDFFAGIVSFLLVESVYYYTAAPNVTMEDSGESISAMWNFGVCHPPGYPLWTLLAFIFTRIVPGNAAWVCNIFCGLWGALGVGIGAMMISSSLRWFSESLDLSERTLQRVSSVAAITGIGFATAFGFTLPYWSQATVTATYCFHCFLMLSILATLYWWVRDCSNIYKLVAIVFAFSLSMSNHQMTMQLIIPAVIFILLTRPYDFIECSIWLFGAFSVVFLGFAYLGTFPSTGGPHSYGPVWNLAIRQLMTEGVLIGIVFWFRGRKTMWKLGLALLVAVIIGLSPYAYEPIASSSNPPMNWSYTREPAGFFYAINRSQYASSLADMFMGTIGRVLGAKPPTPPADLGKPSETLMVKGLNWLTNANGYLGHTWMEFIKMVPWVCFVFFFLGFASILVLVIEQRAWVLMVMMAFLFTAFFLGLLDSHAYNVSMWLLEVRWHGTSLACLLIVASFGFGISVFKILDILESSRFSRFFYIGAWVIPAFCLLFPADLLQQNWNSYANQRGHWWGWHFGYDMLADLPKGSVVYGGTDPGRFVPTYMIMAESFVPTKYQPKPFDRRDLYIITQNAMGEPFYNRYFRGHYGESRPDMDWWLPKLLHRKEHYPSVPLILPKDSDLDEMVLNYSMQMNKKAQGLQYGEEEPGGANALSAKWVWERNKNEHDFFVEESFPMLWSYPYATPHGLCYQINKEPVKELSPQMVKDDYQFWEDYMSKYLMNDPAFLNDPHARRGFAQLRITMGNIYNYRKMFKEAEAVYLQALKISPGNPGATFALSNIYISQKRIDEAYQVAETAFELDPYDGGCRDLFDHMTGMLKSRENINRLEEQLKTHPDDLNTIVPLFQEYCNWSEVEKSRALADQIFAIRPIDFNLAQQTLQTLISQGRAEDAATYALKWRATDPEDPNSLLSIASVLSIAHKKDEFLKVGREAIEKGGVPMRIRMANDPLNTWLASSKEFQWMLYGGSNVPANDETNTPTTPKESPKKTKHKAE